MVLETILYKDINTLIFTLFSQHQEGIYDIGLTLNHIFVQRKKEEKNI